MANIIAGWTARQVKAPSLKTFLRTGSAALLLALSADAQAAFDYPALGAESRAMGGASLLREADSSALFQNPASLAGLRRPETYLMYDRLYAGLEGVGNISQGLASFGVPTRLGVIGIGLASLQASALLEERTVGVALSRRLSDSVEAGVTGKFLSHRYLVGGDPAATDPVFAHGTSRSALAVDAGAVINLSGSLKAGLAVRNINQPDIGLASEDRVPRELQAGLAWAVPAWDLRATLDYIYRALPSGTLRERSRPGVGLEKSFQGRRVQLRAGAGLDQVSGGLGLQLGRLGFDYAFVLSRNLIADNAGTHQLGVRIRFGGK